jgi:predicted ATPase
VTTVGPESSANNAPPPARAALAGRERDVFRLGAAWGAATRGRPALLLLVGEAGVGKTVLADEAVRLAHATGGTVLRARCDRPLPQPVVDLLDGPGDLGPTLLVLDSLHDARPPDVDLLRRTAQRFAGGTRTRVLVVATVRSAAGEAALEALADLATRIDVRPPR